MKIVSWNANCKFREKYKEISKLGADIYVIQEAENPAFSKNAEYREFVKNGFWIGKLPFKGLLVFSPRQDIRIEPLDWGSNDKRFFLPVRVNDTFALVGCWACNPYIQEFTDFIRVSKKHISKDAIIIGDLNSNVIWDKDNVKSGKTHSSMVEELRGIGLEDIYHFKSGDTQGEEKVPTFYLYRHLDKPYHIDHCFAAPDLIKKMTIHARWQWLSLSDHLPIEIEITEK